MRLLTQPERAQRLAAHQSARAIFSTPALQEFLNHPRVVHCAARSGTQHVFVDNEDFTGETMLEATEKAMRAHPDLGGSHAA